MPGVYKIGVVSRKTGLSASTLRLWEDQYGLVAPTRSSGGTRLYSDSDLERLLYVRHLVRDRGYALNAIADIIEEASSTLPHTLDREARVHATIRSLIHAQSAERAAITLVA